MVHTSLSIYISKSWSVAFIVVMFQLSHISIHVIIILLFNFPIIFFNIYSFFLKNIYTFFNISISLTFSSPQYPLLFHLPTTLYLNITLYLSLHLPFFFLFFFVLSYSQPFTINLSLLTKNKGFSLSCSLNFVVDFFIFLSSLL